MTGTPLIEQLAATIFGNPTGDPVQDEIRAAALAGVARIAEMNTTGFDTREVFDHDYLTSRVGTKEGIFTVTSLGKTGATYLVVLTAHVGDAYRAAVQVYTGKVGENFYKMTLTRAANGSIRMNAGW